MAEALTQTPLPRAKPAAYFEQPLPVAIILGSLFAVTLPMAALELWGGSGAVT